MPIPRKLSLLIAGSLLVFAGLCWMQYWLLVNTYRLEKAAWLRSLSQALESNGRSVTDSLNHRGMQLLIAVVKTDLQNGLLPDPAKLQEIFDRRLLPERQAVRVALGGDSLLKATRYHFVFDQIIVYTGGHADTLLGHAEDPLSLTAGKGLKPDVFFPAGESEQQVGFPAGGGFSRLAVRTRSSLSAPGWQQAVYRRMGITMAGSAVLILAALTLFVASFAAIIRQKRIADITTDFANNMTHELKTPLSAAGVVVQSLRMPEAASDPQWSAELLDLLDKQHARIGRIMDSVLGSAVSHHPEQLRLQLVPLDRIITDLRDMAEHAGRHLDTNVLPGLNCLTDADILTGILVNLVDNAISYTAGDIFVEIHLSTAALRIAVTDQGPSIPQRYHRHLFDKFFRVPQPDAHNVKGLGLGLYICRQQAIMLGGSLSCEVSPEGGNRFILKLKRHAGADTDC